MLRPVFPMDMLRARVIHILVLLHTLYILHTLLVSPPPNIFTHLGLHINTPPETIRAALLQHTHADDARLPEHTEHLLKRLHSRDARSLYVRYGHTVLESCTYCTTPADFALHALPLPLLQYLRTAFLVGILTLRVLHKQRWRKPAIGALIGGALMEAWWVGTVDVRVESEGCVMWHDRLWTCRHLLFLILPPILALLPATSPLSTNPLPALQAAISALESTTTRLHLLKYTRGATMRVPSLRDRAITWWNTERQEGEWVREDAGVQKVAERLGLGFTEGDGKGKLRKTAKEAVRRLMDGFVPSAYWRKVN